MELKIIVDSEIEIEEGYDAEICESFGDLYIILNSLKDIKTNLKGLKFKVNDDQINVSDMQMILDDLSKNSLTSDLFTIEIRTLSVKEYNFINNIFPNGCILDVQAIDDKSLIMILNNGFFNDKIKFIDKYNRYSKLTVMELRNCYNYINTIRSTIERYDLSALEKLLFVFDLVREKTYKNDTNKDKSVCRDVNQILNNDFIVCEGYANLVSVICTSLGIENETIYLKQKDSIYGHVTNLIYLNDDVYDIHGVYEMDITSSFKKYKNDNDYLNNYKYFLSKAKNVIDGKNKQNYFFINEINEISLNRIKDSWIRYNKVFSLQYPNIIIIKASKLLIKRILEVTRKVNDKELEKLCLLELAENKNNNFNDHNVYTIYHKYLDLLNQDINRVKFIQALYKVRRIQHLINPSKYPLSLDIIDKIINTSFPQSKEERVLSYIFGVSDHDFISEIPVVDKIDAETAEEKIETDIKRIKLLNILKNELENKKTKVKK